MKYVFFLIVTVMSLSASSRDLVSDGGFVYPVFSGTVTATGFEQLCPRGNQMQTANVKFIAVTSENGVVMKYKGFDRIFVVVGEPVSETSIIGHVISTRTVRTGINLEVRSLTGDILATPSACSQK